MRILSTLFITLLMVQTAAADGIKDIPGTRAVADQIVHFFQNAEFDKGATYSRKYWAMPQLQLDHLANQLKSQWGPMKKEYGESVGTEFIKTTKLRNRFIRYYYLHKFQNHAAYWTVTFYKPVDEWKLNGVLFKTDPSVLFEEAK